MDDQTKTEKELIDPKVYKQAHKRVIFKSHLIIYILAMAIVWILYFFLFRDTEKSFADQMNGTMTYWKFSAFVTAIWTVIVIFHYFIVYKFNHNMLDKEIKKVQKELAEKKAKLEELQKEGNEE